MNYIYPSSTCQVASCLGYPGAFSFSIFLTTFHSGSSATMPVFFTLLANLSASAVPLDRELTQPWGIKVSNVEIKHVDLPIEMQRAIQLRFLQSLTEVATEKNSTLVFPVPIDLFEPFLKREAKSIAGSESPGEMQE